MATDRRIHKWQARSERLARATTIASLKPAACESRARYAARTAETVNADAMLCSRTAIYCARTGTLLGSFNEMIPATLAQLPTSTAVENENIFYSQKLYHPAWINLSPEILASLQLMFPAQYCVYAAHELQHDDGATNGETRNKILNWLAQASGAHVTELAELLRRVLALIGHYRNLRAHPAANNNTPAGLETVAAARRTSIHCPQIADYAGQPITDYIAALREYFTAIVKRTQAEYHVQSIYRQRQVTLNDVKRISLTLGRQQFKLARDRTANIDNAAFFDVAEIFADTTDLEMAITAKQIEARKDIKYSGNVYKVTNDDLPQSAPSSTTEQPTIDVTAAEPNAPALKIRLFK